MEKFVFKGGTEVPYIASRQNARVITAASLSEKKFREAHRVFLCDGIKLTREAVEFGAVREVFIRESVANAHEETALAAREKGACLTVLSDPAFDKISSERAPQGIISTAQMRCWNSDIGSLAKDKPVLLLDSVRDPGNLGTILRSACAMGNVCVALYSCADIYNSKTVRAAMGAIFKADIFQVADIHGFIDKMKSDGRRVIAASPTGDSLILGKYACFRDDCIVIGNEGHGISQEVLKNTTETMLIPMAENTESLNAAVAASVILWEYFRTF